MRNILDLTKLNIDDSVLFVSVDTDFIGNNIYSEYSIIYKNDGLYINYNKTHHLKTRKYSIEMKVSNIGSNYVQNCEGTNTKTFIPNTIIEGCELVGESAEGHRFIYPSIVRVDKKSSVPLLHKESDIVEV